MFDMVQDCACSSIDAHREDGDGRPLVIVTSEENLQKVMSMVGVSVPIGTLCYDGLWRLKSGGIISVRSFASPTPKFKDGFELSVCNGGVVFTSTDRKHLRRWRLACR